MKKSDLEKGMIIEIRIGKKLLIIDENSNDKPFFDLIDNVYHYLSLNDDLLVVDNHECDVMKVYKDFTMKELLWERKETTPILTDDDEKAILRNIVKKWKYIARDNTNELCIYEEKPRKIDSFWQGSTWMFLSPFNHLFQFIKWEDEEPYLISDLLGD